MTKRLELEILRVVCDYLKTKKALDTHFVEKVVNIVCDELNLYDYLKTLDIYSKPWNGKANDFMGGYSIRDKLVLLNLTGISEIALYNLRGLKFNSLEANVYIYIWAIYYILHELIHVTQAKVAMSDKFDIEARLYKIFFEAYHNIDIGKERVMAGDISFYNLNLWRIDTINKIRNSLAYKYITAERLAEQEAFKIVLNIAKHLNLDISSLISLLKYMYYSSYFRGYDTVLIPTKTYLAIIGKKDVWQEIEVLTPELSFQKRLSLGLEVSNTEIEKFRRNMLNIRRRVMK